MATPKPRKKQVAKPRKIKPTLCLSCESEAQELSNYCVNHDPTIYLRGQETGPIPSTEESSFVPDPRKHLIVSLVKSGIRIVGYLLLLGIPSGWATVAAVVLVASEVGGIVEELI